MADYSVDKYLNFLGNDDGTTLTPSTNYFDASLGTSVVDDNNDGNIDSTDFWNSPSYLYSGFTVNIGGSDFAVFKQPSGGDDSYYIPYNSANNDLSGLNNTSPDLTFTPVANDAVVVNCFAADTMISTPDGAARVDALDIGDMVVTATGEAVPVKWVGRSSVLKLLAGAHMQPVRIRAGALGEGLPHSDLVVTADHGMIIDDLVINAGALVNGSTIDWVPLADLPDRVTYYHVETEHHDAILANGAAAETFVDYTGRVAFDNYQDYIDLYGAERIITEMTHPRISSRRLLPPSLCKRFGIGKHAVYAADADMAGEGQAAPYRAA